MIDDDYGELAVGPEDIQNYAAWSEAAQSMYAMIVANDTQATYVVRRAETQSLHDDLRHRLLVPVIAVGQAPAGTEPPRAYTNLPIPMPSTDYSIHLPPIGNATEERRIIIAPGGPDPYSPLVLAIRQRILRLCETRSGRAPPIYMRDSFLKSGTQHVRDHRETYRDIEHAAAHVAGNQINTVRELIGLELAKIAMALLLSHVPSERQESSAVDRHLMQDLGLRRILAGIGSRTGNALARFNKHFALPA